MNTPRMTDELTKRFGLFWTSETKRVQLPLKGVECEFSVRGAQAEVTMTQIFRQENNHALDCDYLFPLPADAAVYFCEADINGRIIRAEVREREAARKLAAELKADGYRVAMVESERENLFTLSLTNLQPDDLIIIRLKYIQPVRDLSGTRSVEIPFCPGIRYIPGKALLRSNRGKGTEDDTGQVPDASRISPVRIDREHPDAAYVDIQGELDGKFVEVKSVGSPSHSIVVRPEGESCAVSVSDKGLIPDRDFVLRWSEKKVERMESRVWLRGGPKGQQEETYALLEIRAPRVEAARETAMDFYFLVDRSGSMAGQKWNKSVEALHRCLDVLGPQDRAMITLFDSSFQDFAEAPMAPKQISADREFRNLKDKCSGNGTEIGPALKHVLRLADTHTEGRLKNLVLITDAQVGNEEDILDLMKGATEFPVHCFGVDIALNDALLIALAKQQGGTFHSLNPNDDIEGAVTGLTATLRAPVMTDLQISPGWETAEARIPNLYSGQIHYISARGTGGQELFLTGQLPKQGRVKIQLAQQTIASDGPYLHWCRARIKRLMAEKKNTEAVALSVQSNLICGLTAFIAWDETERVAVARHDLGQPAMMPAGVRRSMTAGFPEDRRDLLFEDCAPSFRSVSLYKIESRKQDDATTGLRDRIIQEMRVLSQDLKNVDRRRYIVLLVACQDKRWLQALAVVVDELVKIKKQIPPAGPSSDDKRIKLYAQGVEVLQKFERNYGKTSKDIVSYGLVTEMLIKWWEELAGNILAKAEG